MGCLRPTSLELQGFRSFKDKTIISFPTEGALLINGHYNDGTTSSGSGKSSLLEALAFVLGFCELPATELKNWYSKEFFVKVNLFDGTNFYEVTRDPSLKLVVNGQKYEGLTKDAGEKLSEILKTAPDLTKALTYRPQREFGKFINDTDSDNKEFLSSLLGLGAIETAHDQLTQEISTLKSRIETLTSNIKFSVDYLNSQKGIEAECEKAKKEYEDTQRRLDSLSNSDDQINSLLQEITQLDQELVKVNKVSREVQKATYENQSIKTEAINLTEEISSLKQSICPTCKQQWNKAQDTIAQKEVRIKQLSEMMKSNITLINNAKPLLNIEYMTDLNNKKSKAQYAIGQFKAPVLDAQTAKRNAESHLLTLVKNLKKTKELADEVEQKIGEQKALEVELYMTEHSAALVSRTGFLGAIFDEVLADINARANDLMSYIPNINTFTLNISSSAVTKAGKVNKKIEKSVFKDGKKISIKTLSGGQRTSIELCTDLAVREAIRSRSGSNLGWIALDESMDGLGIETKMAAIEVIKSKIKGLIVIVDHSTEIKESFNKVIDVEFDGRNSHVR